MTEQVTIYGVGDLRPALESIGATTRQLSYLVAKGHITPSVRLPGRLNYTKDDLARVFLMLGPLSALDLSTRRWAAGSVIERVFNEPRRYSSEEILDDDFAEFDLEDTKKDRCPAVKLKVDRQEMKADFAAFMGRVAGVPANYGETRSTIPVDLTVVAK